MLSSISSGEASAKNDVARIFEEIVGLEVGEALLFSPAAMLNTTVAVEDVDMADKLLEVMPEKGIVPKKLGTEWVKMMVRKRLTEDGGRSIMAA